MTTATLGQLTVDSNYNQIRITAKYRLVNWRPTVRECGSILCVLMSPRGKNFIAHYKTNHRLLQHSTVILMLRNIHWSMFVDHNLQYWVNNGCSPISGVVPSNETFSKESSINPLASFPYWIPTKITMLWCLRCHQHVDIICLHDSPRSKTTSTRRIQ